ncbi:unnamed protein product [Larinioides sclopetarius]|uniref:Uncharacterized protein n=1 Tax=Larinioides sclopetarius TaxID=280406 RepID=A0AAV1YXU6_9ARAC
MADEIARRREIRKRKILGSSEARIKKIFNVNTNQPLDHIHSLCSAGSSILFMVKIGATSMN